MHDVEPGMAGNYQTSWALKQTSWKRQTLRSWTYVPVFGALFGDCNCLLVDGSIELWSIEYIWGGVLWTHRLDGRPACVSMDTAVHRTGFMTACPWAQ